MVEEEIILAIRNQRLNDIETVFIDIFQYRDKFLETKNDKKPSKINSINTDLSTKIKSSLFISPGGDVRFRYSLLLKDQTIKFDSQYHSIIVLILHYLNQILNSLKNLEKIDLGLSLENLKEILFEFYNCKNNWDNINKQMNIENREEIEKKFKEEEFSKELSNTLLKVRIDNDDLEGALELGNKILEKYKDSYNTLLNLGLVYSKMGDQEKAIDFTNKAPKIFPVNRLIDQLFMFVNKLLNFFVCYSIHKFLLPLQKQNNCFLIYTKSNTHHSPQTPVNCLAQC